MKSRQREDRMLNSFAQAVGVELRAISGRPRSALASAPSSRMSLCLCRVPKGVELRQAFVYSLGLIQSLKEMRRCHSLTIMTGNEHQLGSNDTYPRTFQHHNGVCQVVDQFPELSCIRQAGFYFE